jgi:inositol phosphorylceramide mannosyltransferase catalytic subunit
VISHVIAFANIFGVFRDHAGIRTTQLSIAQLHNSTSPDIRPPVVPKVIHQIYHAWKHPGNNTLPKHWQEARQSCIDHNPDWDVRVSLSLPQMVTKVKGTF